MRSLVLLFSAVLGQSSPQPVRFAVQHADPWAIKSMMEGRPIVSPEISTLLLQMGQPAAAAATASTANLLMGGTLFVNPIDNSLWWIPGRDGVSG